MIFAYYLLKINSTDLEDIKNVLNEHLTLSELETPMIKYFF